VSDAIVQRLMSHHPRVITLGLERIERLLKRLGSPEKKLPPLVHVAGTNGKGSLVAYLRAMAEAAGYRVHVYTSPHLVRFNERIRIAGRLIDDHELDEMLTECEEANGDTPISFFDITTALAFLAFSRVPAELGIIEVGMGGRYDSTNVIDRQVSAITPIGYDHTGFLGDKLEGIAGEKAGIIKRATPAVIGRQRDVKCACDRDRGREARGPAVPHGPRMAGDARHSRLPLRKRSADARSARAGAGRRSPTRQCRYPPSPASSACGLPGSRSTTRRSRKGWRRSNGRPACSS
jgi:dihydrofolate synthase/folylpolyglutamate synthase